MIIPFVCAALAISIAHLLFFTVVRPYLLRRGASVFTGTIGIRLMSELNDYYGYVTNEGKSPWVYHVIRYLYWIFYLGLVLFFIGLLRGCASDRDRSSEALRYERESAVDRMMQE